MFSPHFRWLPCSDVPVKAVDWGTCERGHIWSRRAAELCRMRDPAREGTVCECCTLPFTKPVCLPSHWLPTTALLLASMLLARVRCSLGSVCKFSVWDKVLLLDRHTGPLVTWLPVFTPGSPLAPAMCCRPHLHPSGHLALASLFTCMILLMGNVILPLSSFSSGPCLLQCLGDTPGTERYLLLGDCLDPSLP